MNTSTQLLDQSGSPVKPAERRPVALAPIITDPGKTPALSSSPTPMELLQRAVATGADIAVLERLMALQEQWEKNEARKAFVAALAAFKAEPLHIAKDKHVSFVSKRTGDETDYHHATLAHICEVVVPALSKHGLSHRWKTEQPDGGLITVTCILVHVLGHSEEVTLKAARDESGNKNHIQAVGSTITYLERYTLMSITGLAAADQDDDGLGSEGEEELITAEQKEKIVELMRESGADTRRFLEHFKIAAVDDLPEWRFPDAVGMLERKRDEKKAAS